MKTKITALASTGFIFGIMLCLAGCGTSAGNQKLAKLNIDTAETFLIKGETTTQEVQAQLGAPNDVDLDDKGNKKWIYIHTKSNLKAISYVPYVNLISSGTNDTMKKLIIRFDKNDRVTDYAFTQSKEETKMGLMH